MGTAQQSCQAAGNHLLVGILGQLQWRTKVEPQRLIKKKYSWREEWQILRNGNFGFFKTPVSKGISCATAWARSLAGKLEIFRSCFKIWPLRFSLLSQRIKIQITSAFLNLYCCCTWNFQKRGKLSLWFSLNADMWFILQKNLVWSVIFLKENWILYISKESQP